MKQRQPNSDYSDGPGRAGLVCCMLGGCVWSLVVHAHSLARHKNEDKRCHTDSRKVPTQSTSYHIPYCWSRSPLVAIHRLRSYSNPFKFCAYLSPVTWSPLQQVTANESICRQHTTTNFFPHTSHNQLKNTFRTNPKTGSYNQKLKSSRASKLTNTTKQTSKQTRQTTRQKQWSSTF